MGLRPAVTVVTPVYGNASTLRPLAARLANALDGYEWRLRLVIDGSPDSSLEVARDLARLHRRIGVSGLPRNSGQHQALRVGLAAESGAAVWVCLDADLQDPPEAVPVLVRRMSAGDVDAVFAGRRGAYEGTARLITGRVHRALLGLLTGLPADAGGFVALNPPARQAVLGHDAPSIVAAIGVSGLRTASVPVPRSPRADGASQWTPAARLRQSLRTLSWAARNRRAAASTGSSASVAHAEPPGDVQRWTTTSA